MTLFAESEPVNWGGLLILVLIVLFALSNFAVAVSVWLQQYRKRELVLRTEQATIRAEQAAARLEAVATTLTADAITSLENKTQAAEDRRLVHELLVTISGNMLVLEKREARKEEQLKTAAESARVAAEEVRRIPDKTAAKVIEQMGSGVHPKASPAVEGKNNDNTSSS